MPFTAWARRYSSSAGAIDGQPTQDTGTELTASFDTASVHTIITVHAADLPLDVVVESVNRIGPGGTSGSVTMR
jgi:hypothetical protein